MYIFNMFKRKTIYIKNKQWKALVCTTSLRSQRIVIKSSRDFHFHAVQHKAPSGNRSTCT